MYLPEKGYLRIIVITFYIVLAAVLLFFFFNYLFVPLLPFLIAWLIACAIQPLVNKLHKKAHIPKAITSVTTVLLSISAIAFLLYKLFAKLAEEVVSLINNASTIVNKIPLVTDNVIQWLNNLLEEVPFLTVDDIISTVADNIDTAMVSAVKWTTSFVSSLITYTATYVPYVLIFLIMTIVAACYFGKDFDAINSFVKAQIPARAMRYITEVKAQFIDTTVNYFRAYFLIIVITFSELYVGFSLLNVPYALVLAVCVAIIDVFPILGTGTVLIPWSVYSLITGNFVMGIALIALYIVITVVRQIIEPKIVGSYIGLYPLVTLIFMYIGTRLFGIAGLFGLPIVVIILKNMNDKGVIHLYKNPPANTANQVKQTKIKFNNFKRSTKH